MARMAVHIGESRAARKEQAAQAIVSMPQSRTTRRASAPLFAPGGQSTQMIVGADATDDRTILGHQRTAVRHAPAAAGVLLGLQPHP